MTTPGHYQPSCKPASPPVAAVAGGAPRFASQPPKTASERSAGRTLFGGAVGHFIEWYDWTIYGYLAGVFAGQIFPAKDPTASLIASFSVFAVGFIGRPVGAFILSPLADKYGRRLLLSATIVMAGVGSLVIAVCPAYDRIGIGAPIIVVLARLLQGFSAGGEYQIAITFLNEHASKKRRALAASPQQFVVGIAILFATGVATLVTRYFSPPELATWGWRVPFLVGALMSLFGLYIRSGIAETPSFERLGSSGTVQRPRLLSTVRSHPRETLIVFIMQLNSVQYYIWMVFLPTYAHIAGGLDLASGFLGEVLANAVYTVAIPVFAAISDQVGRKPFLIASAASFVLFSYPSLALLAVPSLHFWTFALVAMGGAVCVSLNNAVLGTVLTELFPTRVRTAGIGIPYAICSALFAGTAPMMATWLQKLGGPAYIAIYVMAICIVSIITHVFVTPETLGRSLDEIT